MTDADRAAWERRFNEVQRLAREDHAAGREPQALTESLAEFQSEYDDAWMSCELERLAKLEDN